jgi:predicted transcriptional regulator
MSEENAFMVEVAADLVRPLEDMSATTGQPAIALVERAVREYLDRNWRPPANSETRTEAPAGTSSYIELTAREELLNVI